jgi:hypothetical protein
MNVPLQTDLKKASKMPLREARRLLDTCRSSSTRRFFIGRLAIEFRKAEEFIRPVMIIIIECKRCGITDKQCHIDEHWWRIGSQGSRVDSIGRSLTFRKTD